MSEELEPKKRGPKPKKKFCINCGSPVDPEDDFCNNCGSPIEKPLPPKEPPKPKKKFCMECGSEVGPEDDFCDNCGAPVGKPKPPKEHPVPPVPPVPAAVPTHYSPAKTEMDVNDLPQEYKPLGAWAYFGYELLFSIPLAGLIVAIVFAAGGTNNINLRNLARGYLLMLLAAFILGVLVTMVFFNNNVRRRPSINDLDDLFEYYESYR